MPTVAHVRNRGQSGYVHNRGQAEVLVGHHRDLRLGTGPELHFVAKTKRKTWCGFMWYWNMGRNQMQAGYPSTHEIGSGSHAGCQVRNAPGVHQDRNRNHADVFVAVDRDISREEFQRMLPPGKEIVDMTTVRPWIRREVFIIHETSGDCAPGYVSAMRRVPGSDRVAFGALDPTNRDFVWYIDYVHGNPRHRDFRIEARGSTDPHSRFLIVGSGPHHNAHIGRSGDGDRITKGGRTLNNWKWFVEEQDNGRVIIKPVVDPGGRLVREGCARSAFVDFHGRIRGDDTFAIVSAEGNDLMGNIGGGSASRVRCPPHQVLTGIQTKNNGSLLTQVTSLRCTPLTDVLHRRVVKNVVPMPGGGGGGDGNTVISDCNPGKMVVGMTTQFDEGAFGGAVAGMALACRAPGQGGNPSMTSTSGRSSGKNLNFQACGNRGVPSGVAVGVRGRFGGVVDAVGIECSDQVRPRTPFPTRLPASLRDTPNRRLGAPGAIQTVNCPAGKALVGINAITDGQGRVVGVNQISCADMEYVTGRRRTPTGSRLTTVTGAGHNDGNPRFIGCRRGGATAFVGRSEGNQIRAFRLGCKHTGGSEFAQHHAGRLDGPGSLGMHACGPSQIATGVEVAEHDGVLKTLGVRCSDIPAPPRPQAPPANFVTGRRQFPAGTLPLPPSSASLHASSSGDPPPPPVPSRRDASLNGTGRAGVSSTCPGDKLMVGLTLKNDQGLLKRVDNMRCASAQEVLDQPPRAFAQTDHNFGTRVNVNRGPNTGDTHDYQCPAGYVSSSLIGFRLSDGSIGGGLMACRNIRTGQLATAHTTGLTPSSARLHGSQISFRSVVSAATGGASERVADAVSSGAGHVASAGQAAVGGISQGLSRAQQIAQQGSRFAFNNIERGFNSIPAIPGVGNVVGRLNQGIGYVGQGVNYIPVVGPAAIGVTNTAASATEQIAQATVNAPGAMIGTLNALVNPPAPPPIPDPITITAAGRAGCPTGDITGSDATSNRLGPRGGPITGIRSIGVSLANDRVSEIRTNCGTSNAVIPPPPPPPVRPSPPPPSVSRPTPPPSVPTQLQLPGGGFNIAHAGISLPSAISLTTPIDAQPLEDPEPAPAAQTAPSSDDDGDDDKNTTWYIVGGVGGLLLIILIILIIVFVKKNNAPSASPKK